MSGRRPGPAAAGTDNSGNTKKEISIYVYSEILSPFILVSEDQGRVVLLTAAHLNQRQWDTSD